MMERAADLEAVFAAIDERDAARFAAFLAEDAEFCFGNGDPVRGRAAIEAYCASFFAALGGLAHRIEAAWVVTGGLACHGTVCYRRRDRSELTVPFANVFYTSGGRIDRYLIFVDNSDLF
jgi:ketosteroid isomerase-like protein